MVSVCNFAVGAGLVTAGVVFPSKWYALLGGTGIISSAVLRHESGGRKDDHCVLNGCHALYAAVRPVSKCAMRTSLFCLKCQKLP